jgi:hypothetical protein
MKTFFQRFPDLCHDIFDQLDDPNLAKSKEVSVTWCSFINLENIWWIRMIQKYWDEEDPDVWRKVIVRTPIEIVKNFAIASRQFYKCYEKIRNMSPLHIMAHSGDLQLCRQIFEKLKLEDPKCKKGFTSLHYAAWGANIEIYKYLMKNLKEIHPVSNDGFTPLYIAAQNGHYDICKITIDNMDEKNPAINGGFTPLHIAAKNGHFDICKLTMWMKRILQAMMDSHLFTWLPSMVIMIFAKSLLTIWMKRILKSMGDTHLFT